MRGTLVAVLLLLWALDALSGRALGGVAHVLPAAALGLVVARVWRRTRFTGATLTEPERSLDLRSW